jgi:hypothetical protein
MNGLRFFKQGPLVKSLGSPSAYVTVLYPNGGEVFEPGDTCHIEWESNDLAVFQKLYYIRYGLGDWGFIDSIDGDARSYDWRVPNYGGDYKVRVDFYLDLFTPISDESDDYFKVWVLHKPVLKDSVLSDWTVYLWWSWDPGPYSLLYYELFRQRNNGPTEMLSNIHMRDYWDKDSLDKGELRTYWVVACYMEVDDPWPPSIKRISSNPVHVYRPKDPEPGNVTLELKGKLIKEWKAYLWWTIQIQPPDSFIEINGYVMMRDNDVGAPLDPCAKNYLDPHPYEPGESHYYQLFLYWRWPGESGPWHKTPSNIVVITRSDRGCPTLFTYFDNFWLNANSILPRSEWRSGMVNDWYLIEAPIEPTDEVYPLELREYEACESWIDQLKLIAVDHPVWTDVGITPDGDVLTYISGESPSSAINSQGEQILEAISEIDERWVELDSIGYLDIGFEPVDWERIGILLAFGKVPGVDSGGPARPMKPMCIVETNSGSIDTLYSRANEALFLLEVPKPASDSGLAIRVKCVGNARINYAAFTNPTDRWVELQECGLSSAIRYQEGMSDSLDVTSSLQNLDSSYAALEPGGRISLEFSKIPDPLSDWKRDFILFTAGHYAEGSGGQQGYGSGPLLKYALYQNFPNPCQGPTMIRFQVPRPTPVSLKLYDVSGRLVRVLIDSKTQNLEPNTYNLTWDGKDDRGIELPSGVYFYRLETGDFQASKKLVLIR